MPPLQSSKQGTDLCNMLGQAEVNKLKVLFLFNMLVQAEVNKLKGLRFIQCCLDYWEGVQLAASCNRTKVIVGSS